MVSTKDPIQTLLADESITPAERRSVLTRAYWLIEQQCVVIPGSMRFINKQVTQAFAGLPERRVRQLTPVSVAIANAMQHERERHKCWIETRRQEAVKYDTEVWV